MENLNFVENQLYPNYKVDPELPAIYSIRRDKCLQINANKSGKKYSTVSIDGIGMSTHRFIWTFCNGAIPEGYEVDHINDDSHDNRLSNLQLLTPSENRKKSSKNKDYKSIGANAWKRRENVKAIEIESGNVSFYPSRYQVQQYLGINAGMVTHVVSGFCKIAKSKINGKSYRFEFVNENDIDETKFFKKIDPRIGMKYKKKNQ